MKLCDIKLGRTYRHDDGAGGFLLFVAKEIKGDVVSGTLKHHPEAVGRDWLCSAADGEIPFLTEHSPELRAIASSGDELERLRAIEAAAKAYKRAVLERRRLNETDFSPGWFAREVAASDRKRAAGEALFALLGDVS